MKTFNVTKHKSFSLEGFKNHWSDQCVSVISCDFNLSWKAAGLPEASGHLWLFGFQIFEFIFYDRTI